MGRWLLGFLSLLSLTAAAQTGGGLYVAGGGFDFARTAGRAIAQNPNSRFFFLVTGDALRYLALTAPPDMVDVRNSVARSDVVFLVCRRDVDAGPYGLGDLVPGVVPVRGWPTPDSPPLIRNYYPDEDPGTLPGAADTLRRLRATCS